MALPLPSGRMLVLAVGAMGVLLGMFANLGRAQQARWADTTNLDGRRAKALFVRGMTQSYLEDYTEAVAYFEKALEVAPGEPALLSALAEAEAARDNMTSGLYYARKARNQAPGHPHYHRALAHLLEAADRPREAMDTYRTLLARFPNQQDAYLPLARLLRDQQRPHAALRAYRSFIDATSRPPPRVYTEMLELYKQTGATDGLEQVLKRLIERQRDDQSYRRRLGRLYVDQERYAEAIPIYEALLRRHPDDPRLLSRLQRLYEKTGHAPPDNVERSTELDNASPARLQSRAHALYEKARQSDAPLDSAGVAPARRLLRQALDRDPAHVPSLALLGTLTLEMGAPAEAAALFQRAIDEDPRAPDRWGKLATAHRRAGHLQRAINAAEEGLLLFPGRPALLRSLALARLQRGEYNAALSRFQQALDKVDSTPQTNALRAALLAGRGRAYDRLSQTENAVADYENALRLDPEQLAALRHLAFHLVRSDPDNKRAHQLAQRAVDAFPTHPKALDTLGWIRFKQGDPAAARPHLENALDTGSTPTVVYDHFADVLRALGHEQRARKYRQKALERAPERDSIRQQRPSVPPG